MSTGAAALGVSDRRRAGLAALRLRPAVVRRARIDRRARRLACCSTCRRRDAASVWPTRSARTRCRTRASTPSTPIWRWGCRSTGATMRPRRAILRKLGLRQVRLLTNNPLKSAALERTRRPGRRAGAASQYRRTPSIAHYLRTKADRMGHLLASSCERARPVQVALAASGSPPRASVELRSEDAARRRAQPTSASRRSPRPSATAARCSCFAARSPTAWSSTCRRCAARSSFPIKYGYASVGRVAEARRTTSADLRPGDAVFVLHPHQSNYVVPAHDAGPPARGPGPDAGRLHGQRRDRQSTSFWTPRRGSASGSPSSARGWSVC